MSGIYRTILADPPWPEHGGGKIKRGADRHYPLMSVKAIKALNVASLCAPSCDLYLWVTNNYLPDGIDVLRAWGFRYITCITWAKEGNGGLGQYFQGQSEQCLFGVKGDREYKVIDGVKQRGRTLITAPRGEHSQKPEALRMMAEQVSYGPFIELFARTQAPGWDTWGFDAPDPVNLEALGIGPLFQG